MMHNPGKELLWVVPRMPWPPRCGASVANCELISAMAERGYKIILICYAENKNPSEHALAKQNLGVDAIHIIQWPLLFRNRWSRLLLSLVFQFLPGSLPLSVIPFTLSRCVGRIKYQLSKNPFTPAIWDGLHPMAAQLKPGKYLHQGLQIYRAHNIEAQIWQGYGCALPRLLSRLFSSQILKMSLFEQKCMEQCSGIAFVQGEDEHWFKENISAEKPTQVVPISTKPKADRVLQQIARWKSLRCQGERESGLSLLWVGGLDWWPNKQALDWFFEKVWNPLLALRSDVHLSLVGKGTDPLELYQKRNVTGYGFKSDIEDDFKNADLLIVPIQSGSGMRVKALEALSRAVPCIGTPLGVCGLPQEGLFVCKEAAEWVKTLVHTTPEECFIRGMMGCRAVTHQFGRAASAQKLEELLKICAANDTSAQMPNSSA